LSGKDENLIRKIFLLFDDFQFHLRVVHFLVKTDESEEENNKMEALRSIFEKEEKSGKIAFKIIKVKEDKQTAINQFIESQSIDLIAFQPHKHSVFYNLFTRKITKKNFQATNVPLLALPIC
jgi:hypothetical protein